MRMKVISISILTSLLSGCIAAVVAGAAAGMIVYDKRSIRTIERDARIFHQIHTETVNNPEFDHSRVAVTSFNRVVLLAGQVSSSSLRFKAEKVARKTPEVVRVYNQINIGDPIPYSQRAKDSWITGQVRSLMLTKKGLESGSIRIVTEDGIVYLMGIATPEQASLAADVARRVEGVKKVVKLFQYIR